MNQTYVGHQCGDLQQYVQQQYGNIFRVTGLLSPVDSPHKGQ